MKKRDDLNKYLVPLTLTQKKLRSHIKNIYQLVLQIKRIETYMTSASLKKCLRYFLYQ